MQGWLFAATLFPCFALTSIAATNLYLVLFLAFSIRYRSEFKFSSLPKAPLYLLAAYIIWSFFATSVSTFSTHWKSQFEELSTLLAILPGIVVGASLQRFERAYKYVGVALLFISLYAIYQYFFGWDLLRHRALASVFSHYHATGLQDFHLTFAGVVTLFSFPVYAISQPAISRSAPFSLIFSVIASMARSMLLAIGSTSLILLAFGTRKLKWLALIGIVMIPLLSLTLFSASGERMARGVGISGDSTQQGDPTRNMIWKSAINIIRIYPVAGVGNDNWNAAFKIYREPFDRYSTTAHPHNDILSSAVEYGIPGALLFITFWLSHLLHLIRSSWNSAGEQRNRLLALGVPILAILFGGLFQCYQTDAEVALALWFTVGVGWSMSSKMSSES